MKKEKAVLFLLLSTVLSLTGLQAAERLDLKLRVYEGARQGSVEPASLVTASYMRPTISANLEMAAGPDLEKEKSQIKRVFNLQDINLITEADLVIGGDAPSPDSVRHFFRLNGNAFSVHVLLEEWKNPARFLVLFNEIVADKPKNILTTEMLLHGGHSAVFGFEDRKGKPYFCSFHITGPPDKIMPPPPPPPPAPPLTPEEKEKIKQFESGAVKAENSIPPPKLLKRVDPVYPEEAREKKLQGIVILSVRTDKQGFVKNTLILKSSNELFSSAAVAAVKQWRYEPYIKDGEPKEIVFTVTVKFALR